MQRVLTSGMGGTAGDECALRHSRDDVWLKRAVGFEGENQRIKVPNQCVTTRMITEDTPQTGCWVLDPDTGQHTWRPVTIEYSDENFIAVKPDDPDIVYIGAVGSSPGGEGALQHYNHRTRQLRLINIWPEEVFGWAPRPREMHGSVCSAERVFWSARGGGTRERVLRGTVPSRTRPWGSRCGVETPLFRLCPVLPGRLSFS